jgi:hypothetical protein
MKSIDLIYFKNKIPFKNSKSNKDKENPEAICVIFKMIEKTHRKRFKKTTKCCRMKQKEELKKEKKKLKKPSELHKFGLIS